MSERPVAPLVGAWIEIFLPFVGCRMVNVAPLVGAWIEMSTNGDTAPSAKVAPLVGAWIEIRQFFHKEPQLGSLPLWERGLKLSLIVCVHLLQSRSPCGSVD